jgi:hypothetical protein
MWWYKHLFIIGLQIIAFIPYIIGSYRFYKRRNNFMIFLTIGIILDIIMTFAPFIYSFPRMEESQGAPWSSPLFLVHILTAGTGMFGFIIMYIYLIFKGINHKYSWLRNFQYFILLRLWIFGVGIALINFLVKAAFNVRIYDYM